ncbi:MAG: hypothetical protein M3Q24_02065 [bacterium]|nr:hypothetical protein [bacterium]
MNEYISNIASFSSDTLIILGLTALLMIIGFKFGKSVLVSIILSLYITIFLYSNTFLTDKLFFTNSGETMFLWNTLAILGIFFVPIYILIRRFVQTEFGRGSLGLLKLLLLSASTALFIMAILYQKLPIDDLYRFSPDISSLLGGEISYTLLLLAPLIILFF